MAPSPKRVVGSAVVSAAALASLLGAPAASADDICVRECVVQPTLYLNDGRANAFIKGEDQAQANKYDAFLKYGRENAFYKIIDTAGGAQDAFYKFFAKIVQPGD